jgi:hypothetical protein
MSLFTHLLPDELERYLGEIARVLKRDGQALMTFYLLNDDALRAIATGKLDPQYSFRFDHGSHRVTWEDAPGYIVACEEEFLRQACADAGLRLLETHYGQWCGRAEYLS